VIYRTEAFFWSGRITFCVFIVASLLAIMQFPAFAAGSVTLAWQPSTDTNVVGYNIYFGGASETYTNKISAGNAVNSVISNLVQGATYYFAATAYDSTGMESPFSNEASYAVPLNVVSNPPVVNNPPTLNTISNVVINENAGAQTMNLNGISSGATNEIQTLNITATSSNPSLIPAPTVNYVSPKWRGTLSFTPLPNATGTATITVTVNDGQATNNLVTQTFTITVNAVIQSPTLNPISNFSLTENAAAQTVSLTGISSGIPGGKQTITITATTSNGALIPTPKIKYTGPNSAGTLTFAPGKNATGTATITVTINNGQTTNTRTFTVTVNAIVTQPPTLNPIGNLFITENTGDQTVNLSGISPGSSATNKKPKLKITATSSNPALFKKATVKYKVPETVGTLTFKLLKNAIGTTTITVTANNGETVNNLASQTFTVTVLASSSITPAAAIKPSEQAAFSPITVILTPVAHVNGQFALTVSSSSDQECIIQASTNLVNWIPVWTNTPPFTYTDINAGQFSQRFYRSIPAP
jgi:hypothetical protein